MSRVSPIHCIACVVVFTVLGRLGRFCNYPHSLFEVLFGLSFKDEGFMVHRRC